MRSLAFLTLNSLTPASCHKEKVEAFLPRGSSGSGSGRLKEEWYPSWGTFVLAVSLMGHG